MWRGSKVDVGGGGGGGGATTYSCAINLRVSILSQAEHSQSHECLESCLEIYRALIDEV